MNTPFKSKCDAFHLAYVNEVNEYLSQGFELYGPTLYDPVKQTFCQPLAKYRPKNIRHVLHLTPREKECLYYLQVKDKCSYKHLARYMSCSGSNVKDILKKLRQKVGARKTADILKRLNVYEIET